MSRFGLREKRRHRAVASSLVFALMTAVAAFVVGDSGSSDNPGPTITIDDGPERIKSGGGIYGIAVDPDGPIVVTALLNGLPRMGPPDTSSTSAANEFCFPIPPIQGPAVITIIATDKTGATTRILVPIP